MNMEKAKGSCETCLDGNISTFKAELDKLSKKELLEFAYLVDSLPGGDGLYLCSRCYLMED